MTYFTDIIYIDAISAHFAGTITSVFNSLHFTRVQFLGDFTLIR